MSLDDAQSTQFLLELYRMTEGDGSVQVATQDIAGVIGLDKDAAARISENLIGEGWVEIKTLSGGIGITDDGVAAARAAGGQDAASDVPLNIGHGPVLDPGGRAVVEALANEIKQHLSTASTPYDGMEEMIMDIKTLEIQMCSPQPKTAIVREVLRSLHGNLEKYGAVQAAQRFAAAIKE